MVNTSKILCKVRWY